MLLLVGGLGCEIGQADLVAFEQTATGPEKLRAIVADEDRKVLLRASAALSLLTLDRADVNGQKLLLRQLKQLPEAQQAELLPAFAQGLKVTLSGPRGGPPRAAAVAAKDAAAALLPHLGPSAKATLGAQLVRWVGNDLPRRGDVGRYGLEQIAQQTGVSASIQLAEAMSRTAEPLSLLRLAAAISPDAAPETRATAARRLSGLSHEVLSADPKALGKFADRASARHGLLAMARDATLSARVRSGCLDELRGHVTMAELPGLEALASSAETPEPLRLLAVHLWAEPRAKSAVKGLLKLIVEDTPPRLRRAAGEHVLEIGGPDSLTAFLRRLPSGRTLRYSKGEIDAYAERINAFPRSQGVLKRLGPALYSAHGWQRVLCLRYVAVNGLPEDLWRLRKQLDTPMAVVGEGWPQGHTVGSVAREGLSVALDRLGLPR